MTLHSYLLQVSQEALVTKARKAFARIDFHTAHLLTQVIYTVMLWSDVKQLQAPLRARVRRVLPPNQVSV